MVRTWIMPRSGRDFDGRTSSTSLLACNSSPGRTGRGQLKLVEADAENAAGGFEFAVDHKPHGHCGGMPAARRQALERRMARRLFVEMEGLRIELLREREDLVLVDPQCGRS